MARLQFEPGRSMLAPTWLSSSARTSSNTCQARSLPSNTGILLGGGCLILGQVDSQPKLLKRLGPCLSLWLNTMQFFPDPQQVESFLPMTFFVSRTGNAVALSWPSLAQLPVMPLLLSQPIAGLLTAVLLLPRAPWLRCVASRLVFSRMPIAILTFQQRVAIQLHIMRIRSVTYSPDAVFQALANPTRRAVLDLLRSGNRPAGEIARAFPFRAQRFPSTCISSAVRISLRMSAEDAIATTG